MRLVLLGLSIAMVSWAQQGAAQAMKLFASSADVAALAAKSKNERKADQPMVAQRILGLAPYNANLEYRVAVANASQHDTEAEMFYVIEGSGTIVTGGKLVEGKQTGQNWSGKAIEGGETRQIAKGDFVMVPEKTPHWFSAINGTLVLMSIHLPHPLAMH